MRNEESKKVSKFDNIDNAFEYNSETQTDISVAGLNLTPLSDFDEDNEPVPQSGVLYIRRNFETQTPIIENLV